MTSRPILVTGAAGFVGSHVLALLRNGRAAADSSAGVVGWHRPGRPPTLTGAPAVRWQAVDLLDRSTVVAEVERLQPAMVYHCAGAAHVGNASHQIEATFAVNVLGTHHLLDGLARVSGGVRVLIPGSAHVYKPATEALTESHPLVPAGPYGLSKLAQELVGSHTRGTGVEVTIARAFNHLGPRQDPSFSTSGFARQIAAIETGRQAPEIVVGNLESRRDFTDVRDTVRAYQIILERGEPARPYNVCSGSAVSIGEMLAMLVARAHVPVEIRVDRTRFRPNDFPVLVGDPGRLRSELGWMPEIPLSQTLDDILDYWRRERN